MQEKLKLAIEEAEKNRLLTDRYYCELQELRARFLDVDDMVFESRALRKVMAMVLRLANVDSTVLITGESGAGKEIIAILIHRISRRRQEAFVMAAMVDNPDFSFRILAHANEYGVDSYSTSQVSLAAVPADHKVNGILEALDEEPTEGPGIAIAGGREKFRASRISELFKSIPARSLIRPTGISEYSGG